MKLRDYQQDMLVQMRDAWTKHRSVMVQMPTGTGKTVLLAETIHQFTINNSQLTIDDGILIVAHRIELIGQISRTLDRFGIEHGLIVSGKPTDKTKRVQVASIQTLSHRLERTDDMDSNGAANNNSSLSTFHFSLIIIDEAHHAQAKTYRMLWDRWPEARFLGLTATPCRMNHVGFTDLFSTMLVSRPIQEFIDKGWLSDFDYISARPDNPMMRQIAGLQKRGADGDYQTKEMAMVMDVPESIGHLYNTYRQYVNGKKGIVYAIDREHARHITEYYQKHGVSCCWIEAKTPAAERERLVEEYRADRIKVCVNVDILGEGVDFPEVEFIQLARPTLSLSKYLQQVGRGMRVSEGKECVTILDQVGLYQTFGLPTDERDWNAMFTGRIAGKAGQGGERPLVIRDEAEEKELVNLEMVRIKRRGEKHTGAEMFMLGGKYGVMFDGNITCPAEFEHIRRLPGGYFALATYPYSTYRNKVTVIDLKGRDQKVAFYGTVRQEGDLFYGRSDSGKMLYWDGKGRTYYDTLPEFERVGNLDMIRVGKGQYRLRRPSPLMPYVVSKKDIFYNDKLTVIRDIIILNDENRTVLKPVRYFGHKMQVESRKDKLSVFRWVTLAEGLTDDYTTNVYFDGSRSPYWKDARMMNAATGKMEYLSPEWVEREGRRKAFEKLRSELARKNSNWVITDKMLQSYISRNNK
ncbi:MAG: DEAD/DEAH box helicase [Bacteroidaceae bacterium]|nr:DEAD/DEAH box helicase [Bacteroidaceae bacterium]